MGLRCEARQPDPRGPALWTARYSLCWSSWETSVLIMAKNIARVMLSVHLLCAGSVHQALYTLLLIFYLQT